MEGKFKTIATADLVRDGLNISIKPKMLVFKSLGGYANGDIKLAEKIVQDLADFLIKNNLVITKGVISNGESLVFMAAEDLPELVKNLTDDVS